MADIEGKNHLIEAATLIGDAAILYLVSQWAFSKSQKEVVRQRQDYTCADCGDRVPDNFEVHHINPQCKGGSDTLDNAIGLCGPKHHGNDCHERADKLALEQGILWDGTEITLSYVPKISKQPSRRQARKLRRRRRKR